MNVCPSCSKTVDPNDLVCPHCGISLHQGTSTAGPASGGGKGLSVVAIVVIGIVGIVLLIACLGVVGGAFWFLVDLPGVAPSAPAPPPAIKKTAAPQPVETLPVLEGGTENPPAGVDPTPESSPEESTETP
jgi:hypothetical protein